MGLIACLYRAAEWRHKRVELAATTSSSTSTSAAAEPFVGAQGTPEEQGGRHAQDVEVELGWTPGSIPAAAVVVPSQRPCSLHLTSPLTVGIDLGKSWSA